MQQQCPGLTSEWAAATLFDLIGKAEDFFAMPDEDSASAAESKDFVQKAGGWLSRNWGSGEKSDSSAIGTRLLDLANATASHVVGKSGIEALAVLSQVLDRAGKSESNPDKLLKQLKKLVGWKGRPSKGAIALEKLGRQDLVTSEVWEQARTKLQEEAGDQSAKASSSGEKPQWMPAWREQMERLLGMPYRTDKDLIWESGVMLDHALRRVSSAHTWIKRAEVERRQFIEGARKPVPDDARKWLDDFREQRSGQSFALDEYLIRKRAIDGWEKVVQAWAKLGVTSARQQRIDEAREVQRNLDDNDKFGDIQLFAGFGDDDSDDPKQCLADDSAECVWRNADGLPDPTILKNYSESTVAQYNQRRFKVPAYRHPDPLRHPVFVDFGNSRWGIEYSALKAAHSQVSVREKLSNAKTDNARQKFQQQLNAVPDLQGVTLDLWNGQTVESVPLRWHGKRMWKDLDLQHFGEDAGTSATRADRLGRSIAGQPGGAIGIMDVFSQQDWNGRLQVPRRELDYLADLIYGKGKDADFNRLDLLSTDPSLARARSRWDRLNWFLTTSAKLKPQGPWLNYADRLPDGIAYKKGRSGPYLHYDTNKDRKGRARLTLARLPGLRVLSLDLGHRCAAACAVWETLSTPQIEAACREQGHSLPGVDQLYVHLKRPSDKNHQTGPRKGQPIEETAIYRRIGPDVLADGTKHAAPWARLDRQFLIKLPGEDGLVRFATTDEFEAFKRLCNFVGLNTEEATQLQKYPGCVNRRIDELQADSVRIAQLGLRRLGNLARVAFILTATRKPLAGGGETEDLTREQRIDYVLDALLLWQELAQSSDYQDAWAKEQWQTWVKQTLGGPQPLKIAQDVSRSERKKKIDNSREPLRPVAEQLANAGGDMNRELHQLFSKQWEERRQQWQVMLRWLRRFILPRIGKRPSGNDAETFAKWKAQVRTIRQTGGLSLRRLRTIREVYHVLKAFHMRPEPDDLRRNVPKLGDDSLAKFGRRILDQLERMREQRVKQLASRIIEAALGVGSEDRSKHWNGRQRPATSIADPRFAPCHAVVIEDLENYRPEESQLRRENRQLMTWSARNVRKYIVEGCQLNGLHFVEFSPRYTSKQDSRTGAPGMRCEDVVRLDLEYAQRGRTGNERRFTIARLKGELSRLREPSKELSVREQVLNAAVDRLHELPANQRSIRLPRRGGEIFVSADPHSPAAKGIQADLNAAANIGIKALLDTDWWGAWWFVLVDLKTGLPDPEKVKGSPIWQQHGTTLLLPISDKAKEFKAKGSQRDRTSVYAWNPLHWQHTDTSIPAGWLATPEYWKHVECAVANNLIGQLNAVETPW